LKNRNRIGSSFFLVTLITFIVSCVEPFDINYNLTKNVYIVDATLTDEADDQFVILKQSNYNSTNKISDITVVKSAKVEIIVNGIENIPFTENKNDPGNYLGPKGFKAEHGKTYQLFVTLSTGKQFKSKIEKLEKGTEIKKIYQQLVLEGKPIDKNFKAYHKIYLDTQDPLEKGNNYLWDWKLYEEQEVCLTCGQGERYYTRPLPGNCIKDLPPALRNVVYDYECYGACYEIIHATSVNIMSDELSNGKIITARPIAEVPIYHLNRGSLIEVKQQAINAAAYKYYKILIDQNQKSGGLADTPPVSLIGNIESVDNTETIAGYFKVVDESKYNYWVDRSDVLKTDIKPIFIIGRPTNFEPTDQDLTRPPLAPCLNTYTRTNIKPKGWKDPQ
jgi:Domain of unknown function (DUF4249)